MGRSPEAPCPLDPESSRSIWQRTTRIRDALNMRIRHIRLPHGQRQLRLLPNGPRTTDSPSIGRIIDIGVATWTHCLAQRGTYLPNHHEPSARRDDSYIQSRPSRPAIPPRSSRSNDRISRSMRNMASASIPDANRSQQFLATRISRVPRKRLANGRPSARHADALRLRTRKSQKSLTNDSRN